MYLLHSILGDSKVLTKILEDGYLLPSNSTKNVKLSGTESPYIFLRLNMKGDKTGTFYLDADLLLECIFYLNVMWRGRLDKESIKVDGRKLTHEQLEKILHDFEDYVRKTVQPTFNEGNFIMMSNEILVKKRINLKKYLKKIKLDGIKLDKTTLEIIKNNYKGVVIL